MKKETYSTSLVAIPKIPLVKKGDNIGDIIVACSKSASLKINNKDILVIASKIISKAEGRQVSLKAIKPSLEAIRISKISGKDPRIVEIILKEAQITEVRLGVIETLHPLGFVCTNAGIDKSNTGLPEEEIVVLLPLNPDESARKIQRRVKELTDKEVGVVVNDSLGMKYRHGSIGLAIGLAGIPALLTNKNLEKDLYGKQRRFKISFADEIAAAASLLMGQSNFGFPVVILKGLLYPKGDGELKDIIETKLLQNDLKKNKDS